MSEFKFSCPGCGQHIQADDSYAGRQINCPACQSPLIVPQSPNAPPPRAGLSIAAGPPAPAPSPAPASGWGTPGRQGSQRPVPPARKSKTNWVVIGSVCGVLVAGGIAWAVYSGALSHSESKTAAPPAKTAATATNSQELSVGEIVDKVAAKYGSLSNYSSVSKVIIEMDMSKLDLKNVPGMNKLPKNAKSSQAIKEQMSKPIRMEINCSVKLGRPEHYRVEWESKSGPAAVKGAAWSAGEGDFVSLTKTKYTKLDDRAAAMKVASAASGGTADVIPNIFFKDALSALNIFKDGKRGTDENVRGEDCYVLNGEMEMMRMKIVVWVAKDTFLIKQARVVMGGQSRSPEMTDAQMDAELNKAGKMTAAQKAEAKTQLKLAKQVNETITATYENIETDRPMKKADFVYELPPGAKLSKTAY